MHKLYFIFIFLLTGSLLPFYSLPQNRGVVVRQNVNSNKVSYHSNNRIPGNKNLTGKENSRTLRDSYHSNYSMLRKRELSGRENSQATRESYRSDYNLHQERREGERKYSRLYRESYRPTLDGIGNGLSSGKIASFSNLFSSQIYLNLSNGVSAYYSSNQAYYVIQDFLKTHRALSLNINDIQEDQENVYAMGTYSILEKGRRESSHVYISLKLCGKKWQITQITIN
jgi:hypothetical protein